MPSSVASKAPDIRSQGNPSTVFSKSVHIETDHLPQVQEKKTGHKKALLAGFWLGTLATAGVVGKYSGEIWTGIKTGASEVGDFFGGLEEPAIGANVGFFVGGIVLVAHGLFQSVVSTNSRFNKQFTGIDQFLDKFQRGDVQFKEGQFKFKDGTDTTIKDAAAYNKYGKLLERIHIGRVSNARLLEKINACTAQSSDSLDSPRVASFRSLKKVLDSDMRTSQRVKSVKAFTSYVAGGTLIGVGVGGVGAGIGALSGLAAGLSHLLLSQSALQGKISAVADRIDSIEKQSSQEKVLGMDLNTFNSQLNDTCKAIKQISLTTSPRSWTSLLEQAKSLSKQLDNPKMPVLVKQSDILTDRPESAPDHSNQQPKVVKTTEENTRARIYASLSDAIEALQLPPNPQGLDERATITLLDNLERIVSLADLNPDIREKTLGKLENLLSELSVIRKAASDTGASRKIAILDPVIQDEIDNLFVEVVKRRINEKTTTEVDLQGPNLLSNLASIESNRPVRTIEQELEKFQHAKMRVQNIMASFDSSPSQDKQQTLIDFCTLVDKTQDTWSELKSAQLPFLSAHEAVKQDNREENKHVFDEALQSLNTAEVDFIKDKTALEASTMNVTQILAESQHDTQAETTAAPVKRSLPEPIPEPGLEPEQSTSSESFVSDHSAANDSTTDDNDNAYTPPKPASRPTIPTAAESTDT